MEMRRSKPNGVAWEFQTGHVQHAVWGMRGILQHSEAAVGLGAKTRLWLGDQNASNSWILDQLQEIFLRLLSGFTFY
jgi:hypothetical protein